MTQPRLFVEVGQRIGSGVVSEIDLRIPRGNGTIRAARMLCDCGNEYVLPVHLLTGQRKPRQSCGCRTKELITAGLIRAHEVRRGQRGIGFIDRTGQRYGKLVVIELGPAAPGPKVRWLCRCDCGNEKLVRAECLSKGMSKSCGCERVLTLPPGVAARNMTIKGYKWAAQKRGLTWELTVEDFDRITSQDCFYCGCAPSAVTNGRASSFTYNGIDRVDNNVGYRLDNVVTCCKTCNRAKNAMPYDEFMAWIGRLVRHNWFHPEQLPSRVIKGAA